MVQLYHRLLYTSSLFNLKMELSCLWLPAVALNKLCSRLKAAETYHTPCPDCALLKIELGVLRDEVQLLKDMILDKKETSPEATAEITHEEIYNPQSGADEVKRLSWDAKNASVFGIQRENIHRVFFLSIIPVAMVCKTMHPSPNIRRYNVWSWGKIY